MEFVKYFIVAGSVMGLLDWFWLSTVAKKFYASEIGKLLLDKPNMVAALSFYLVYLVGVVMFVVAPAIEKQSFVYALLYGAMFGLVAYATYDLTNMATLKGWTTKVVLVDMLWGAVLTAVVSSVTYWVVTTWFS